MTIREINEQEARATVVTFFHAIIMARQTIARWSLAKNKPSKREMLNLVSTLYSAESAVLEMAKGEPSDGHSLDGIHTYLVEQREKLDAEIR